MGVKVKAGRGRQQPLEPVGNEREDAVRRASARRLLLDRVRSVEAAIRYAVGEHLKYLFPKDQRIQIRHDPTSEGTSILMEPVRETAAEQGAPSG